MTSHPHLLLVAIGPIQDFIRQARRTRDLWHGSHLLSELSRCVARSVARNGGELVFPALKFGDPELAPCYSPLRRTGEAPLSVANKILAVVPAGRDPSQLASTAKATLARFWRDRIGARVKGRCADLIANEVDDVWNEQLDTLIEYVAAWTPFEPGKYDEARRQLEQTLGGRKNLREFSRWQHDRIGAPKSSFDGGRVSVLKEGASRPDGLAKRYRIGPNEQLDAVGLIKRAGGQKSGVDGSNDLQFVPISNIAAAGWLRLVHDADAKALDDVKSWCARTGAGRIDRRTLPCVAPFPWDGSVLFEDRIPAVLKELAVGQPKAAAKELSEAFARLQKRFGMPTPYVACIVADGDGMGLAIDRLTRDAERANPRREPHFKSPQDRNFEFSKALSSFAAEAREIVEQQHFGSLVYAGGDDVLAFVPVAAALDCAERLRVTFERIMAAACVGLDAKDRPTLSVGVGIGHTMEGMGDLLELGRDAEKLAKGADLPQGKDRNALGIIVDKRSGGRRFFRAQWTEHDRNVVAQLKSDALLIGVELSAGKIYELQSVVGSLPKPDEIAEDKSASWARLLRAEASLCLSRSQIGQASPGTASTAKFGLVWPPDPSQFEACRATATAWIDRMLVAREVHAATPRVRTVTAPGSSVLL